MEIELKYFLESGKTGERIREDLEKAYGDDYSDYNEERLVSIYYDTADGALMNSRTAFRIRKEGKSVTATLKWGGSANNGLHIREEVNIPLDAEDVPESPDISVFKNTEYEKYAEMLDGLLEGRVLEETVVTDFTRKSWRIRTGDTVMEFCCDEGEIRAAGRKDLLSELEIELVEGDDTVLRKTGETVARDYRLQPETRSKYARGLALLTCDN